MFLRQSTASQEVLLGPFLDDTDGKTAETGLTIANTDIKVWKSGGTTESNKNSGGATHIASGRYYAVLDATDTDTVGLLEINVHVSGALPVRRQLYVLEEAVYDALFAASAAGYSTLTQSQVTGGAYALNSASFAFNAAMGLTTQQKADVNTEADTAATDYGALKPTTVGRTILVDSSGYVTYANTAPLDAAGVRSAVGLAAANLDTQLGDIPTVSEFNARTLVAANYATTADLLTIAGDIGTIDAAVAAIQSKTDNLPASPASSADCITAADVRAAIGLASANLDTQLGDVPTVAEFEARTLLAASYATASALSTVADNVVLVLADTGTDGVVLSAATCNKIADHVRRRTQANVEASSDGDALSLLSLYGVIQQIQEGNAVGTTLTVYRTDGTTSLGTRTLATDPAADPVTGVS